MNKIYYLQLTMLLKVWLKKDSFTFPDIEITAPFLPQHYATNIFLTFASKTFLKYSFTIVAVFDNTIFLIYEQTTALANSK